MENRNSLALILVTMILISCNNYKSYVGKSTSTYMGSWMLLYENNTYESINLGGYSSGSIKDISGEYKLLEPDFNVVSRRNVDLKILKDRDKLGNTFLRIMNFNGNVNIKVYKVSQTKPIFEVTQVAAEILIPLSKELINDSIYLSLNSFVSKPFVIDSFGLEIYPILPKCLVYQFYGEEDYLLLKQTNKKELYQVISIDGQKVVYNYKKKRLSKRKYDVLLDSFK